MVALLENSSSFVRPLLSSVRWMFERGTRKLSQKRNNVKQRFSNLDLVLTVPSVDGMMISLTGEKCNPEIYCFAKTIVQRGFSGWMKSERLDSAVKKDRDDQ